MADEQSRSRRFSMALNQRVQGALRGPRQAVRRVFGSSDALSDLYFSVVKKAFSREHRAVLHGIHKHEQFEQDGGASRFPLRRNIHRIEKGLLMRPRRDIFALNYIEETLDAYERVVTTFSRSGGDSEEIRWAHDVLTEYFTVTASDPLIDRMQERIEKLPGIDVPEGKSASRPYLRDLEAPRPVEYEDFYRLTKRRRSVRWFLPDLVPRELIDQALVAAIEAPSACNRQPFRFHIFDDPALVQEIANMPMGTKGFAHNFPAIVVLVGQLRAYFHPRDRHIIYIDASLAAMGFMLALETLGLSSCAINWPDIPDKEQKMADALDLDPDQRPIMLIAVGFPDPEGAVACSQKQSLDNLRTYNR